MDARVSYATLCILLVALLVTADQDMEEIESLIQTRAGPEIYSLHVETDIAYRFATTKVISRLANRANEAKEAVFAMTIPKTAFITSFVMTIDGVDYPGEVKEKVKAKKEYEVAKQRGESAGRVSAVQTRNTFQFRVAVNVAPQNKVDFNLTYQELLERKLGFYEYVLNINPGHVVRDMRVDVFIRESREITGVRVPPLKRNATSVPDFTIDNPDVKIMRDGRSSYHVLYDPDEAMQTRDAADGVSGQLVVQYDVMRDTDAGEIQVIDGYFVHYFSPSGLEPVNKNVLFIIDSSGSMSRFKMAQTKDAMFTILDDLRVGDKFNIITFADYVSKWSEEMSEVSVDTRRQAKSFVRNITAYGGTNINDGLLRGISMLEREWEKEWTKKPSIIIFLTDGEPTSGISSPNRILENVRKANRGRYTIFSLGFGQDLDFGFMQKISLQNNGLARRIYADSDATLQLEGFYSEVSTPVLSEVEISYVGDVVESDQVTDIKFPAYYRGSEIVVAGKLKDGIRNLNTKVQGHASAGFMQFDSEVRIPKTEREALQTAYSNFTERLWAFMTIRKLLDTVLESANATERNIAKARALDLSLKYSFVTPLTSMVVTKPDEPKRNIGALEDEETKEKVSVQHKKLNTKPSSGSSRRSSFVDNDPHFIVQVEGMTDAVCFNIDDMPGVVYQLLYDKQNQVVINGLVVGKKEKPKGHKYPRTYIGELRLIHDSISVHVTPAGIKIYQHGNVYKNESWEKSIRIQFSDVDVFMEAKHKVFIRVGDNIVFAVLRHLVNKSHKTKVNFLGLYIIEPRGLSLESHGVLGQFLHMNASVHNIKTKGSKKLGQLHLDGPHGAHREVKVKRIKRRDMDRKDYVTCWNAKNNGLGLLEGTHKNYVVENMTSSQELSINRQIFKRREQLPHPNSLRSKIGET